MIRYAIAAALLLGTIGTAVAQQPHEATNSSTASQLALAIRACNQLDAQDRRDACKKEAWDQRGYNLRGPLREPGRFERTYN